MIKGEETEMDEKKSNEIKREGGREGQKKTKSLKEIEYTKA